MSIAMTTQETLELGREIAERIPQLAIGQKNADAWTTAVHTALSHAVIQRTGWRLQPSDVPKRDEYLCDFMLMEVGYGCRVACESQWNHGASRHQGNLDWAFDKLRGVKADVKLFICEGEDAHWGAVSKSYLLDYAQLSPDETFVVLRWSHDHFVKTWWSPTVAGLQREPIVFEAF